MTPALLITIAYLASPLLQLPDPPTRVTFYLPNGATVTGTIDDTGLSWMQRRTDENGLDYYHSGFTLTGVEVTGWPEKDADINGDGKVDAFDLSQVLADWTGT